MVTKPRGYVGPEYSFDTFLVDPGNASCVSACRRIAGRTEETRRPLLVYGNEGVGKSHLIHATANALMERGGSRVLVLSAERFVAGLFVATREGGRREYLEHCRSVDVLMVDEIQFFVGRPDARRALISVTHALVDMCKTVVFVSDVPRPWTWAGRYEEVRGVGYETRVRILGQTARSLDLVGR